MEENEMLEQTNETENTETETAEEMVEGIDLTDTTETDETQETETVEETKEVKKTLRELLEENPEYQEELNERIIKPRLARQERNYQKELSKYKDTDNVLRSTLKVNDGEDVNQKLREYYESEGIKLPSRYEPGLSSREIEALAKADVEDIMAEGNEAMMAEANRLASKGYKNLNERERYVFDSLAETLTEEKNRTELLTLGADEKLLEDKKFKTFKSQFNSNTPIKTIFELYQKSNSQKDDIKPMGSMKDTNTKNNTEKDFYSPEDVEKLTQEDWNKPGVWEKVRASQRKWKK